MSLLQLLKEIPLSNKPPTSQQPIYMQKCHSPLLHRVDGNLCIKFRKGKLPHLGHIGYIFQWPFYNNDPEQSLAICYTIIEREMSPSILNPRLQNLDIHS
jgi:hypothetical protein